MQVRYVLLQLPVFRASDVYLPAFLYRHLLPVMELSFCIVTRIVLQYPARASSMLLSTTSYTKMMKTSSVPVLPMYIPGLFRTASRPSKYLYLLRAILLELFVFRHSPILLSLATFIVARFFHLHKFLYILDSKSHFLLKNRRNRRFLH